MIGVERLWAKTEEVSMEGTCSSHCKGCSLRSFGACFTFSPPRFSPRIHGALLPVFVACEWQYIQKQTTKALQCQLRRVQGDTWVIEFTTCQASIFFISRNLISWCIFVSPVHWWFDLIYHLNSQQSARAVLPCQSTKITINRKQ